MSDTSPWPPPRWDPPSPVEVIPPPPPVAHAPRPWAAAVWMGICALAGLAGAASVFLPYVTVEGRGYSGFDPQLNDWLTGADASTIGVVGVFAGSLLALGAAATMMRALDRDTAMNWRLVGLFVMAAGIVCGYGSMEAARAIEKVFGPPEADAWGPGVPLGMLAAVVNVAVGAVLLLAPSRSTR